MVSPPTPPVWEIHKVPEPPAPSALMCEPSHIFKFNDVLWRIHRTTGPYALPWNELRHYGPVPGMRFDPHDPPPASQTAGVCYTACNLTTCIAEMYQEFRTVNATRGDAHLTSWQPVRDLELLDLTGRWPVLNGASATLMMGWKEISQKWARAIRIAWPDLDGIYSRSAVTNDPTCVLFTPAKSSFPGSPLQSTALSAPLLFSQVTSVAKSINYAVI